jgi:hypothetical protein
MKRPILILLATAAAASTGCAARDTAAPMAGAETYIPYASRDGITEYRVVANDRLYARALTGGWYLVRLTGPCPGLRSEMPLSFDTRQGRLDRFGAILVERDYCPVESVIRIEGEPPRDPRRS